MDHYCDAFLQDLDLRRLQVYIKSTSFVCKSFTVCGSVTAYNYIQLMIMINEEFDIEKRVDMFCYTYRRCVKCRWRNRELDVESVIFLLKLCGIGHVVVKHFLHIYDIYCEI